MGRAILIAVAAAALAGCEGWEGPGNWLDEGFEVGAPASACRGVDELPDGRFPVDNHPNTGFSNWEGRVRGQDVRCVALQLREHRLLLIGYGGNRWINNDRRVAVSDW